MDSVTKAVDKGPQVNPVRANSTLEQWQRLCLVMKHGDHHIPSAECNYGYSRSLARTHAWGNISHSWRGFHVKIPSCFTHHAKENTTLGKGISQRKEASP